MMDRGVAKGFEAIAGSEEALGDRGGAKNDAVDSVVESEAAAANDWFIGVTSGRYW